ncbi:type II toxin-antitoxin system Phd/YefM family antitoxin [Patescibacteria group bacterium]|nr:type II toxin-antitoxin system Phd/YefM family antitoxin [Patescibacteria group bacterium]
MNIKTTLSATEARQDFFNILSKVEKTNVPFTITINGVPKVVIMNAEEFDSWQETLEIMSNPELVKGIEQGKKDLREGRYSTFEEVFGMTPEEALADKGKKVYRAKKSKRK